MGNLNCWRTSQDDGSNPAIKITLSKASRHVKHESQIPVSQLELSDWIMEQQNEDSIYTEDKEISDPYKSWSHFDNSILVKKNALDYTLPWNVEIRGLLKNKSNVLVGMRSAKLRNKRKKMVQLMDMRKRMERQFGFS